jgi:hypothetical protein
MMTFAIGIKEPFDVTIQRTHDPDPRHHRGTAASYQHQCLNRRLSFGCGRFFVGQGGNVTGGIVQGDKPAPVRQRDRLVKPAAPA